MKKEYHQREKNCLYRAQVVERAFENNVNIVQANAPQRNEPLEGSYGQSRIVNPNGQYVYEASILLEEVLIQVLDLKQTMGGLAERV